MWGPANLIKISEWHHVLPDLLIKDKILKISPNSFLSMKTKDYSSIINITPCLTGFEKISEKNIIHCNNKCYDASKRNSYSWYDPNHGVFILALSKQKIQFLDSAIVLSKGLSCRMTFSGDNFSLERKVLAANNSEVPRYSLWCKLARDWQ